MSSSEAFRFHRAMCQVRGCQVCAGGADDGMDSFSTLGMALSNWLVVRDRTARVSGYPDNWFDHLAKELADD